MKVRCPECSTVMAPKLKADVKPGQKVQITCRCGQKLRFTAPGKPEPTEHEKARAQAFADKIFGPDHPIRKFHVSVRGQVVQGTETVDLKRWAEAYVAKVLELERVTPADGNVGQAASPTRPKERAS